MTISELQQIIHANAMAHGWWDEPRNDGEIIALCHSELSEALEALRDGNPPSVKAPGFCSLAEELADVMIRVMDYAEARGLNLEGAMAAKHAYNKSRPFRHGRAF